MTRAVQVVDAGRPEEVLEALRAALAGAGPAVVPRAEGAAGAAWPSETDRVAQNVAVVIETSGSTGVPKRVALSTDALLASAAASAGAMGGQGQWLLALPAHYVAGVQVLVRSLAAETEPVMYGGGHFDPSRFAAVATGMVHDLRFTSLVPVQLARLVEAAEGGSAEVARALRRFDGILVGGQALTPVLRERAEALGARILSTYGSSETAGGCVYDGVPIGSTVVRETDGVLEISGPTLAEGYVGDRGRTAAAFHEDGGLRWYRTGDLGRVEGGRVTVLGRADNVIISGGEKVLLDAVEAVVRGIEGFGGAVVVAAEDAQWGQVPVVVVGGEPAAGNGERGTSGALARVREAVADRLGRAAAPARILEVESIPRLSSGKPDRRRLADAVGRSGGSDGGVPGTHTGSGA
ncbi:AMP-binding protein [Leifsonia sp. F6_8S_P_1B]|uniref:AMP-binding protein n=1 Tax=Leifsonia williamsii TaxID=3035919 RepID=A0ABT8K885_9MICO|nr:AMP-binding protein [Leifsonia williamsii]MDN4613676.1 AMP-binding protein [Leifsonia williamsii]